jgi:hypothetical protein
VRLPVEDVLELAFNAFENILAFPEGDVLCGHNHRAMRLVDIDAFVPIHQLEEARLLCLQQSFLGRRAQHDLLPVQFRVDDSLSRIQDRSSGFTCSHSALANGQ